ncbi:MAG: DUF481 domain-containing protein [Bdellovibrionales bacterium]|nr:DUF481 domain-containing protein [Bdellovibrionales bacterium]
MRSVVTRSLLLSVLFCGAATSVEAADPGPAAVQDATKDWDVSVSLGFSLTEGNSDTSLLALGSNVEKTEGADQWRFKLAGQYGQSDGVKDNQSITGEGQYRHRLSERWYGAGEVTGEHDDIADLTYRFVGTPSIGYYLLKLDDFRLALESGPAYVVEKQGGHAENYPAWSAVERLKWDISPTSVIHQSFRAFVSLEDTRDSVLKNSLSLDNKIIGNLSLTLSLEHTYDNHPAAGAERNDLALITGLKLAL